MLKNISILCRVCCGPGEHDISKPIPFYLQETNRNDAEKWREPLCGLLQEILHIPVTRDDGFPQKICTVCVSYLMHAITFRKQAISTRVGLIQATLLYKKQNEAKEELLPQENHQQVSCPQTIEDKNDNLKRVTVNKVQAKAKLPSCSKKKSCQAENDKNIPPMVVAETKSYFTFRQKAFVEDDITTMPLFDGRNFAANAPDKLFQGKCQFCRMCFFLVESYDDHVSRCIHKKFTVFIHQCNQTMAMKLERKISFNEFLRRMIFLIKSTHEIIGRLENGTEVEEDVETTDTTSERASSSESRTEEETDNDSSHLPETTQHDDLRKVFCSNCGRGFLTISHLDVHRLRCH
ncbi:hypothetical protein DMENIID0001_012830 [Sergentomyia squamirostris]